MKKKPPEIPKVGTHDFADHVCKQFVAITEMLQDVVGKDAFLDHCAFAVGCTYKEKDGVEQKGIVVNARGNVWVSIKMVATMIDLAAINIQNNAKDEQLTKAQALDVVLNEVRNELLHSRREVME